MSEPNNVAESSRAIARLLSERSQAFDEVLHATTTTQRDRMFQVWRNLTHEIEVLQA